MFWASEGVFLESQFLEFCEVLANNFYEKLWF